MQGSANLNLMIKAARKAARGLVKDFREVENLQVSAKGPADFVSRAVRQAEAVIKEELLAGRASYGWVGAETGVTEGEDPTRRWIVDALDGTTNFLHGIPHWSISIALEHKGEIVSALVYDAPKDEMFYAEKGAGCWLNDNRRLRVSGRNRMSDSLFATGMPHGVKKTLPATLKDLTATMPGTAGMRRSGSVALDLAWVAAGRYEGHWERELNIWEMAAGILLVKEAGGLVEAVREDQDPISSGSILAANEQIFASLAKALRG